MTAWTAGGDGTSIAIYSYRLNLHGLINEAIFSNIRDSSL